MYSLKRKRNNMIGKIISISDSLGQGFINKFEIEWNNHGFEVENMDFESIINLATKINR